METHNIGPYSWQKGRKPGHVSYIKQFDHKFKLGDIVIPTIGVSRFPTRVVRVEFSIDAITPGEHVRYGTQEAFDSHSVVYYNEGDLEIYNPVTLVVGQTYIFDLSKECKGRTPVGWRWRKETKRRVVAKYPDGRIIFVATEGPTKNLEQVVKEEDIVRSTLEVVIYS